MLVERLDPRFYIMEAPLQVVDPQLEILVFHELFVAHLENPRHLVYVILLVSLPVEPGFNFAELFSRVHFGRVHLKVSLVVKDLLEPFQTGSQAMLQVASEKGQC